MSTKCQKGLYADYHCLRPFNKHKEFNEKILELIN